MKPSSLHRSALLVAALAGCTASVRALPGITLTPYATGKFMSQSTWGTGFSTVNNVGPLGILPLSTTQVLVTDYNGDLRTFAYDTPHPPTLGQPTHVQSDGTLLANFGQGNAVGLGALFNTNTATWEYYMTQQSLGRVVRLTPSTGAIVFVANVPTATGIVAQPPGASYPGSAAHANHLFISRGSGGITEVDPSNGSTSQLTTNSADGLVFTKSGRYLMFATQSTGFVVYDMQTNTIAYTAPISPADGADGIALGVGGPFTFGYAYINTNSGKVFEVQYDTNPSNSLELEPPTNPVINLIASGGTRGDFIAVDTRVLCSGATHYPSLLITQSGTIERIDPPDSGFFGPPFSVEAAIADSQSFCAGDGTLPTSCPCFNFGLPGRGCDNSIGSGGSLLTLTGSTQPDSIVLAASGELPSAVSLFLQGSVDVSNGVVFGDGVRCAGGTLKRLAVKTAVNGEVAFPGSGDPSITARSAALGDTIAPSTPRFYQVYYRDPVTAFCGGATTTFNISNAVRVDW